MRGLATSFVCLLQAAYVFAAPAPAAARPRGGYIPVRRSVNASGSSGACGSATNRGCWLDDGWDINTDYELNVPSTGVTRTYTFEVTEHDSWAGPDGKTKTTAMLINGGFPGPVIEANWGDSITVTVINKLKTNGTSFHWHGIRQLNNNINDGVGGITECPISPGQTREYTWVAEQYGSSWYHSHFGSQYGNGLVGSIQIYGPSSADYDIDLGPLAITDWYYGGADEIGFRLNHPVNNTPVAPPPSDNVLFNGMNVSPDGSGGGEYHRMTLQRGKKHKLRLINTSVDNTFTVSLVNHQMTIVQTDFVPIAPVTVDHLFIDIGQRYEVVISADQEADNYWFNVTMDGSQLCGTTNAASPAMIFEYEDGPAYGTGALPGQAGSAPPASGCVDDLAYTPIVTRTAPSSQFTFTAGNNLNVELLSNTSTVKWDVSGQSINVTWDEPTLQYVAQGRTDFPPNYNVIQNPDDNEWSFWVIQNVGPVPHPIHLHGHDFLILARSSPVPDPASMTAALFKSDYAFDAGTQVEVLNYNNPVRRDATTLPAWGWVVLAFKTDNPGAWLFHCHIAWHVSQGLGIQFLERLSDIPVDETLNGIQSTCTNWQSYWTSSSNDKYDSGL